MENIDWNYNEKQISELEEQYGNYWNDLMIQLGELWSWDLYFFYKTRCDFSRYRYENLFIFLSGHSTYSEHPTLRVNDKTTILVEQIRNNIYSSNFTVLVEACYSFSWVNLFTHDNLNKIYTSDLENKLSLINYYTQGGTPWNETVGLHRIESFSYFFIEQLLRGKNFEQANSFAISRAYFLNLTGVDG
jgi:hypothetical protein